MTVPNTTPAEDAPLEDGEGAGGAAGDAEQELGPVEPEGDGS
jgi:hypothetical protein